MVMKNKQILRGLPLALSAFLEEGVALIRKKVVVFPTGMQMSLIIKADTMGSV